MHLWREKLELHSKKTKTCDDHLLNEIKGNTSGFIYYRSCKSYENWEEMGIRKIGHMILRRTLFIQYIEYQIFLHILTTNFEPFKVSLTFTDTRDLNQIYPHISHYTDLWLHVVGWIHTTLNLHKSTYRVCYEIGLSSLWNLKILTCWWIP